MTRTATKTVRLQARVTQSQMDKVKAWADELGVTMGQLAGMAIQAGLDAIIRAVSPVDSVTPEKWAEIIEAMDQKKAREIAK